MKPTVGRIVHFTDGAMDPPEQFAAIITRAVPREPLDHELLEEHTYTVSLKIADTIEWHDRLDVPYSMTYQPGCWSWPPRE